MDFDDIKWKIVPFQELSGQILYDIMKLRVDVFVVEQQCPYPELDGKDQDAIHIYAQVNNEIIGCGRIFLQGSFYEQEASFGRIVVEPKYRGKNLGKAIVRKCLDYIKEKVGDVEVKIAAQSYLRKFYEEFGFQVISEEYDWDGIPHFDFQYKIS